MSYIVKPQSPLMLGENGILPLTSYDQIIMPDGTRWTGESGGIKANENSSLNVAEDGTVTIKVGEGLKIAEDGTISLAYANGDEVSY